MNQTIPQSIDNQVVSDKPRKNKVIQQESKYVLGSDEDITRSFSSAMERMTYTVSVWG